MKPLDRKAEFIRKRGKFVHIARKRGVSPGYVSGVLYGEYSESDMAKAIRSDIARVIGRPVPEVFPPAA